MSWWWRAWNRAILKQKSGKKSRLASGTTLLEAAMSLVAVASAQQHRREASDRRSLLSINSLIVRNATLSSIRLPATSCVRISQWQALHLALAQLPGQILLARECRNAVIRTSRVEIGVVSDSSLSGTMGGELAAASCLSEEECTWVLQSPIGEHVAYERHIQLRVTCNKDQGGVGTVSLQFTSRGSSACCVCIRWVYHGHFCIHFILAVLYCCRMTPVERAAAVLVAVINCTDSFFNRSAWCPSSAKDCQAGPVPFQLCDGMMLDEVGWDAADGDGGAPSMPKPSGGARHRLDLCSARDFVVSGKSMENHLTDVMSALTDARVSRASFCKTIGLNRDYGRWHDVVETLNMISRAIQDSFCEGDGPADDMMSDDVRIRRGVGSELEQQDDHASESDSEAEPVIGGSDGSDSEGAASDLESGDQDSDHADVVRCGLQQLVTLLRLAPSTSSGSSSGTGLADDRESNLTSIHLHSMYVCSSTECQACMSCVMHSLVCCAPPIVLTALI